MPSTSPPTPAPAPAPAAPPKLELRDITKRFGNQHVLAGISFTVAAGELLVLLGRSGCGKSTLLRIVAGLDEPTSGDICIDGRPANALPPDRRDLAMVFQSYALYPHLTVRENIAFPLTVRRVARPERERRTAEVAELLGLSDLLDRLPAALSGGQRQRVAIGRALIKRPSLFLFDEPLSNLDAALRTRMRLELKALHARLSATMVYVTHDQVEAMTLATRVAVIEGGRLQQLDPPERIYREPANRFVAAFVGSPAMNLLDGAIEAGTFVATGFRLPLAGRFPAAAAGAAVTLGIRPEEVGVDVDADADADADADSKAAADPAARAVACAGAGVGAGADVGRGVGAASRFAVDIDLVEPVGDRGYVHARLRGSDTPLRATVAGSRAFALARGGQAHLVIDPRHVHLFDAAGLRIAPADAPSTDAAAQTAPSAAAHAAATPSAAASPSTPPAARFA